MTFTGSEIEQITQDVLRELRSRGVMLMSARSHGADHSTGGKPHTTNIRSEASDIQLLLNERVITEAVLESAGAAGRTVCLPGNAIITPSGHDYIRRNAVKVSGAATGDAPAVDSLLISIGNCAVAKAAAASAHWPYVVAGCEVDAARKAVTGLGSGAVVCCGGEPSVIACLINRDSSRRAAVVGIQTDLDRLCRAMNPGVICVESSGMSFGRLQNLLRRCSQRNADLPAGWKELTGGSR